MSRKLALKIMKDWSFGLVPTARFYVYRGDRLWFQEVWLGIEKRIFKRLEE
jgi:hypothetical protein